MSQKHRATEAFAEVEVELRSISKWMYENPELAFEEFESSRRLSEFLGDHGFEVTYPAYGIDTAFEAHAGSSGPRVVQTYNNISTLRQQFESDDRAHGVIDHGGVAMSSPPTQSRAGSSGLARPSASMS